MNLESGYDFLKCIYITIQAGLHSARPYQCPAGRGTTEAVQFCQMNCTEDASSPKLKGIIELLLSRERI